MGPKTLLFKPLDPRALPAVATTPTHATTSSSAGDKRNGKLSSVINQVDDLEVDVLDDTAIEAAYVRYTKRIGALPPDDQELTSQQLTLFHSLLQSVLRYKIPPPTQTTCGLGLRVEGLGCVLAETLAT